MLTAGNISRLNNTTGWHGVYTECSDSPVHPWEERRLHLTSGRFVFCRGKSFHSLHFVSQVTTTAVPASSSLILLTSSRLFFFATQRSLFAEDLHEISGCILQPLFRSTRCYPLNGFRVQKWFVAFFALLLSFSCTQHLQNLSQGMSFWLSLLLQWTLITPFAFDTRFSALNVWWFFIRFRMSFHAQHVFSGEKREKRGIRVEKGNRKACRIPFYRLIIKFHTHASAYIFPLFHSHSMLTESGCQYQSQLFSFLSNSSMFHVPMLNVPASNAQSVFENYDQRKSVE